MHALFFEMRPKPGHLDHYFDHVARLRPKLARHDGLVFLERYGSLINSDWLLSHQLWESEEAIVAWREEAEHRRSQDDGNKVHFADYRIHVGEQILHRRSNAAGEQPLANATPIGPCVLALYGTQPMRDPMYSTFHSFTRQDRYISLVTCDTPAKIETELTSQSDLPEIEEIAAYSIRRDYGQFDRVEAP